ncbi:MAG: putative toxin-antitoxin system toxin component, PIN family [Gammaproteobacteria bacterium RIFOXYA12_FULL_61_12]|nr:MAG: putative toxin-antitoxin system toxin component, PIN family [Gammaproteobacteria bacterium RIFOXYA12_FULL_61_12]OGT90797.1 MAG: putative toxin-antitoxin system toxin component, PIN family [Gammaproteobacteria bacterium RIFOXYD12_FULL_61_37]
MTVFVIDTNILISYALSVDSVPGQAVRKVFSQGGVAYSHETLQELIDKLAAPKFDRYVSDADRLAFIHRYAFEAARFEVTHPVRACRDPKDDKFLSLALASQASCIISGDKDLLDMTPFRGSPILKPREFLDG